MHLTDLFHPLSQYKNLKSREVGHVGRVICRSSGSGIHGSGARGPEHIERIEKPGTPGRLPQS